MKKIFLILSLSLCCSNIYPHFEDIVVATVDPSAAYEKGHELMRGFSHAPIEKLFAKFAIFLAGTIGACGGTFLINNACYEAFFPKKTTGRQAVVLTPKMKRQRIVKAVVGSLVGAGLTIISLAAIIKSERFFSHA